MGRQAAIDRRRRRAIASSRRAGDRHGKKKRSGDADIRPALGARSGQTTTVAIAISLFDERMQPVRRLIGHGSRVLHFPAWDIGVRPATDAAVMQRAAKLSAPMH